MIDLTEIRFPDEEHEKPFRVYSNYLADLAGVIAGRHGLAPTLIEGIQAGMRSHKPLQLHRIQKRRHGSAADEDIERSLCRAWANARSLERKVDLIAEGAHLLFSRWLFQCKATKSTVQLSDLAKEIGMATCFMPR